MTFLSHPLKLKITNAYSFKYHKHYTGIATSYNITTLACHIKCHWLKEDTVSFMLLKWSMEHKTWIQRELSETGKHTWCSFEATEFPTIDCRFAEERSNSCWTLITPRLLNELYKSLVMHGNIQRGESLLNHKPCKIEEPLVKELETEAVDENRLRTY